MRRLYAVGLIAALAVPAAAQTRRPPVKKPAAAPVVPLEKTPADVTCPALLGAGVRTKLSFCDVMTGREPTEGVLIKLPPHKGPVTLTFDLHNRHTYSEEQVKAHKAFARYTATIGVLTMDNTLISRAVVRNEFRTEKDFVDRIGGGAGPGGIKAVAPTGAEPITIVIPEGEDQVSVLGEKLTVEHQDGAVTYTQPERPIADISNVMIEYRPAPPPKTPARPPAKVPARKR
jgi:hypothetical protein